MSTELGKKQGSDAIEKAHRHVIASEAKQSRSRQRLSAKNRDWQSDLCVCLSLLFAKNGMSKIDTAAKNIGNWYAFTGMKTSMGSEPLLECDGSTSRLYIEEVIL
jgi:hypothetical protein